MFLRSRCIRNLIKESTNQNKYRNTVTEQTKTRPVLPHVKNLPGKTSRLLGLHGIKPAHKLTNNEDPGGNKFIFQIKVYRPEQNTASEGLRSSAFFGEIRKPNRIYSPVRSKNQPTKMSAHLAHNVSAINDYNRKS